MDINTSVIQGLSKKNRTARYVTQVFSTRFKVQGLFH